MKKKTLTYSTSQRGEISLNLNEKRMNFTHLDFKGGSGAIPFSISHIYQNNGIDKGYGTGFLLNLEQTLSKIDGTSKYKLSLPDGSEEIFEEIFYYKDEDDKRVYKTTSGQTLKRSDIEVFEDGTLKYNEHLIYIEVKSDSGMTLKSDYKDFVNSDKIDLRHEDLIQLEEEIEQLENKIQEATEDLNLQMEEAYIFDTPEYEQVETSKDEYHQQSKDLIEKQMASYNITKKENLHNVKEQYYSKTKRENRNIGGLSNLSHDSYIASYISYDENLKRFVFNDADGRNAEKFALMDKYKDEEKFNQISDYAKLAEYYSQSFSDKVNLLNQNIQEISLEIEKEEINFQKSILASQNALLSKEEQYLQKQNAFENLQKNRTIQQYQLIKKRTDLLVEKYVLLKQQKQYQLELLYKQFPELYLINEEGFVFGFNKYGMLCAIFDAYEHQVIIEYNDDHQIKHIIDSESHKIEFIYNGKKKLIRIMNESDAYIDFSYTGNYLTKFIYSNGESFSLKYINDTLIEIQDINDVGFQIDYQHNLISKLKSISFPSLTIQEELTFLYEENHIAITNNQNLLSEHYLFDENNSLTTEYCLKEDEIEEITTYDYEPNHCNFVISSNKNHSKILNAEPTLIEEELLSFNVTPLNSYTSDYILYALASADSVEGIRQRRVTAYCEHFYNHQETECRFEIRCNIFYETHSKAYSVSFNPNIKGKQLVAIPITLDKDENGQVLIPNRMNICFDYRENNGKCQLYHLVMAQGEYIYSENNETHHKVYECFSETVSVKNQFVEKEGNFVQKKEVSYFYNLKDLLEKQRTIITYDEYDSAAMLVHKEVKEVETHFLYNKQNKILKEFDSLGNVIEYTYNSQGDCIHKKSYYKSMPNLAYMEEADIDEDGIVISNTNELGYKTTYQQLNHTPVSITSPNGNVLYLHNSDSATSISLDEDGLENYNTCIYEKGKLVEYNTEGMQYQYTYDEFGKEKELYINNQLYCTFVENKSTSKIYNRTLFCDQTGYEKISDFYGKVLKINKITAGNVFPYIEYVYDSKDRVVKEINYVNHKEVVLEYIYLDDTLIGIKTNEYIKTMSKDLYGNPKDTIYQMGENIYQYSYTYDQKNNVIENSYIVNQEKSFTEEYHYDALNRLKETKNQVILNKYDYLSKNGRTTNLIKANQKFIHGKFQRYNYRYDKEGNVVYKTENHKVTRYSYDALNRLIREDNEALDETILYSYDVNGNILEKKYFNFSLTEQLTSKSMIDFGYKDFNDFLTHVNNQQIVYDAVGNPVVYKDIPLVWDFKELRKYNDIEFTYNANHIRTKKKTANREIEYILDGTRVLKEIRKSYSTYIDGIIEEESKIDTYEEEIEYIYSGQGIVGFDYKVGDIKKRYYYNKNMFGDILEIYDENKILVGKYCYDAYGNHKILIDINNLASINPIRYRSYYFDHETQLYYLNSRYYDPEICRFINMDSIEYIEPEQINGFNLFAYCNNNPVMNVDPEGKSALLIGLLIFMGVMTIGGAIYGGVSAGMAGGSVKDIFAGIGKGALNGFIISGGISLAIGGFSIGATHILGAMMTTYGLSITANMLEVAVTQGKKSYYDNDDFWSGSNDINNALFANSGGILVGQLGFLPIPIYGSRVASKVPTVFKVINDFRWFKGFGINFLAGLKYTLTRPANKLALILGYTITAWQYYSLLKSIVKKPDFNSSKWVLY